MDTCPLCQKSFSKKGLPRHTFYCSKTQNTVNQDIAVEPILPVVEIPIIPEPVQVLITKTSAKEQYRLTNAELDIIPHKQVRNPRFRCAAPMRLYDVVDLVAFCENNNRRAPVERRARQPRQNKQGERREKLISALSALGCTLRNDSRLCDEYIKSGKGDANEIAVIMCEMKFYFDKTNYRNILNKNIQDARECDEWYDYDDMSEISKYEALQRYCRKHANNLRMDEIPESLHDDVNGICSGNVEQDEDSENENI